MRVGFAHRRASRTIRVKSVNPLRLSVDRHLTMETKRARGDAKAVVSRKVKEITRLMADENNVELVDNELRELKEAFRNFQAAHEAFHNQLSDEESESKSQQCTMN